MFGRWCAVIHGLALASAIGCGDDATNGGDANGGDSSGGCSRGNGWSMAPAVLGGAIQETAVVAIEGKIYVLGGFDGASAIVRAVRVFDTVSCSWSDGPPLPRAVHHANAAVANGTIYVLGSMVEGFATIGDVWSWNPATDSGWGTRTSMPGGTERGSAVAGFIDGRIYVAGGLRTGSQTTLSAYSVADDTWNATPLPPLPQPRDHGCGGVVGGKLYFVGGRTSISAPSDLVFEYTPGGSWVQKASMPTGRGGTACGLADDRIIVVGGEGNSAAPSGVFPQTESYTVSADRWDSLAPMLTPRHGMGAAVWNGVFYVPGGATRQGFGAVDTHELLTL